MIVVMKPDTTDNPNVILWERGIRTFDQHYTPQHPRSDSYFRIAIAEPLTHYG